MIIYDIPKDRARKLIAAIADLRPNLSVNITTEDTTLYNLGLVDFIPCSVEIQATEEEIDDLVEDVFQMEADAYNFDDQELKNPAVAKLQKELEIKYRKHSIIVACLGT